MSAPRRPGDDPRPSAKKAGWAKAKPKANKRPFKVNRRRDSEPAPTTGEEAARPVKPVRVRKDGTIASGRSADRTARATSGAAHPTKTANKPSGARPRAERRDTPATAPKTESSAERTRPARVRQDGSVATGRREVRAERTETTTVHARREPQRIAKLLARAGIASRREIERMIVEGRIALNGTPLDTPATTLTSLTGVTVDGRPVETPSATRLFLFHKPTGFLTTANDPRGRPTIYDRLPAGLPRVMPIGRLDMNTEGLLLLTTDGELKRKLELPSSGVPRTYRARAYGEVSQEQLEALIDGVTIEGMRYGPIDANMERRTGRNVWIEIRITEGKNREVRRVLEYLGLQVSRLIRTAYGEFVLADLPAGQVVEVRQHDLVEFRKTLR